MASREEFLKKLRETFKIEAAEGIANISNNLIELEKGQDESRKTALIEATFREAHSLKGASRAVNISEIETVCQALENVFSALKTKSISLNAGLFDLFHNTVNLMNEVLNLNEGESDNSLAKRANGLKKSLSIAELGTLEEVVSNPLIHEKTVAEESKLDAQEPVKPKIAEPADDIILAAFPEPEPEAIVAQKPSPDLKAELKAPVLKTENTIRISVEKLDNLLNQSEEMLSLKQIFSNLGNKLNSVRNKVNLMSHESSGILPLIRDVQKVQGRGSENGLITCTEKELKDIVQFFEWTNSMIKTLEVELTDLNKLNLDESYSSGMKFESLLDEVKKIISVPFSGILDGFPKAARDLSKDLQKLVTLEISGKEIEIDRRILEELRSPLLHLLRNTIDHGIEKPGERRLKNKSETGNLIIKVAHTENNQIEIIFSDDGAGVDLEKVREKYIRQQKITDEKDFQVDEKILIDFLFKSGVSTSELITDISGRGLGLAIVQEKIEQLGGTVSVRTEKDKGTEFKIVVPLSMVTFRGIHLLVAGQTFVVPTSKIIKVERLARTQIKSIENKATIPWNDKIIPLVYLNDILEIPHKENESNYVLIAVMGTLENPIGFAIDEILGEDLILVKKFNNQLRRVRNISGATVTGAGRVIPILNVSDLLKSSNGTIAVRSSEEKGVTESEKNSILVVEDSITSRMLLKNILETSGYKVTTAVDGVEGYSKVKSEHFDLIVSDVDMPRMSGLDMTAKIRSDKTIGEIPIILVTSLSKREDRERGMEVGANGYIVKSNFDQSNLLEVVERLIG